MLNDTMLYNVQTNLQRMDRVQDQIATGKKAHLPHLDPGGVTNSMLFKSRITELDKFSANVADAESRLQFYDTALDSTGQILHRLRELAVQQANGIFNADDRKNVASEVDQLLRQMIDIGNTRYKNETIFSGHKSTTLPFKVFLEKVPGSPHGMINRVEYQGDIGNQTREIEQLQYIDTNLVGNKVFWGDNMMVHSSTPGTNFTAARDQVFRINNVPIEIKAGDNLRVIVQKINDANLPVHASIDNTRGANLLVLETTDPHQLWVEDIKGGTVMQDLGIIGLGSNIPPQNFSTTARVSGGSMFDQIIAFRNSLLVNDQKAIGGLHLAKLDGAVRQISRYRGEVGALSSRMDSVKRRLVTDQVYMKDILSKTEDVDMAEATTNLKMLEFVHKASLQVGSRVIPPTLLDFLR
jgi:flagellar hook-associated protein 3 FlgL